MAKNANPETAASASQMSLADVLTPEFLKTYGKKIGIILGIVALAIAGLVYYNSGKKLEAQQDHKSLGAAMMYMSKNNLDSAKAALEPFFSTSRDKISTAKANLLLGEIYFLSGQYSEALDAYQKINLSPNEYFIITSGADHGIASCYIQQGDYAKALEVLKTFLSNYMKKNEENYFDSKVQDLSPAVPNALWKLALCQNQLGKKEAAKSSCEKLARIYPGTDEASKAEKFLLTL